MSTTLDEVIGTVLRAREDGPDALAAMALSYGATMALGTLRIAALRGQVAEMREAATATDEMVATLRHERDAACAEIKAARESAAETRAEVWRLRESVAALRADIARVAAERGEAQSIAAMRDRALTAAVREREAFGLRASAAERERDEARTERDAALARPTYEARTVAPTPEECAVHRDAGGIWYVTGCTTLSCAVVQSADDAPPWTVRWVPLSRDGLPCAWPVPAAEEGA